MEVLNKVHEKRLVDWAKTRERVVVLSGDLTGSTEISLFKSTYPDRFFSMGMAEQNMLSWAGGMAREGYVPFIHTFAVFLYRRPLDQLEMSVCYPNLPVRLVGFLPGLSTPGGVTHQAIEDIAILRCLPNMTVLEVGDATDIESVLDVTETIDGPVYLRMMRGEVPRLFEKSEPMQLNRSRVIRKGSDITVLTSGHCTEEAMKACALLEEKDISITHLHVSTLRPFTDEVVLDALKSTKFGVITMENHIRTGGLGTAVAEMMAENGIGKKLVRLGINDTYAQGASFKYLMSKHGIDSYALVSQIEKVTGRDFGLQASDFEDIKMPVAGAKASERLEAL